VGRVAFGLLGHTIVAADYSRRVPAWETDERQGGWHGVTGSQLLAALRCADGNDVDGHTLINLQRRYGDLRLSPPNSCSPLNSTCSNVPSLRAHSQHDG
jgi:hypothetical protein